MAAITSTASGNWSSGSTWVGGVAPGNGDTATIAGHTVTVDVPTTVGDGTTTKCITLSNNAAHLVVNADLILFGGGLTINNPGAIVDVTPVSGSITITLKSNGSTVTPTIVYAGTSSATSQVNLNGTASNRVLVTVDTSVATSTPGFLSGAGIRGQWNFTYVTLNGLGSTTQKAMNACRYLNWSNVLITACGQIDHSITNDADPFSMSHVDFRNSALATGTPLLLLQQTVAKTSGTRSISYCTFSGSITQQNQLLVDSLAVDHTIFDSIRTTLTTNAIHQRYTYCWWVGQGDGTGGNSRVLMNYNADNTFTNCVVSQNASGGTNSHIFQEQTTNAGSTANTWTSCVYDGFNSSTTGDFVSNAGPVSITYGLFIDRGGNLCNGVQATTATSTVEHCTVNGYSNNAAGYGAVVVSETAQAATKLISIQSNIFANDYGGVTEGTTGTFLPQTQGTIDYNAYYNMTGGFMWYNGAVKTYVWRPNLTRTTGTTSSSSDSTHVTPASVVGIIVGDWFGINGVGTAVVTAINGSILTLGANDVGTTGITMTGGGGQAYTVYTGYFSDSKLYGATDFGGHDVNADPRFIDRTRTAGTWDTSLGGDGTYSHLRNEVLKLSGWDINAATASYNSAYALEAWLSYIRRGFTPTNAALHNTGHDGADIGAIAYQAIGNAPQKISLSLGMGLS